MPSLGRSIAPRLAVRLVAVTTLVLVAAGGVAIWSQYQQGHRQLAENTSTTANQVSAALALPLWNFQSEVVNRILDSAMEADYVAGIVVDQANVAAPGGASVFARRRDAQWHPAAGPSPLSAGGIVETRAINYDGKAIGTLNVIATSRWTDSRLRSDLAALLAIIVLVDAVLIASLYALLRREVITPLQMIRDFAARVTADGGETASAPQRRFHGELDRLRSSIETMVQLLHGRYAALRDSEELFRTSFESATVGVCLVATDGRFLNVNRALCDMLGYSREELLQFTFNDVTHEDDRHIGNTFLANMQSGGREVMRTEKRYLHKDGKVVWVYLSTALIGQSSDDGGHLISYLQDITETKQAETTIRKSESKYREIVEQSPLGIFQLTMEGQLIGANRALATMFGYDSQDQMIGDQSPAAALRFGPRQQQDELVRAVCGLPGSIQRGVEYRRRDGTVFPANVNVRAVEGTRRFIEGFVEDISLRKQSSERLEMLRLSVENHFDAAYWMDTDNRIVYVNDTACRVMGYTKEEFLGKSITLISPKATAPMLLEVWRQLRETGSLSREALHRRKDGSEVEVEIVASHVRIDGKEFNCGFARDITERKRTQQELLWKTAFLEAQVDSAPDGILVVDEWAKTILTNDRFFRLLRIPEDLVAERDDRKVLEYFSGQVKQQQLFNERVAYLYSRPDEVGRDEIELTDGTILDRYSSPVRDKTGKYYGRIWTFRDITEQRKLEDHLRQSQKMEGIGQLAGGVAHDFNNILAVIMMHAEIAAASHSLPQAVQDGLREILVAAERAANLTRQLLLFSRKQVMQSTVLDLNDVVRNISSMLQRLIREDIQLQLRLHPAPLQTLADAGMLEQVLLNLVVNARDAMPEGGTLLIETSAKQIDADLLAQYGDVRLGRHVSLVVSDTGTGIPAKVLPHIFEPFYTTKQPGKGTGLGLATVFGIVKQHSGVLKVESAPGEGARFEILLPDSASNIETGIERGGQAPREGSETILLVEDEELVREVTQLLLVQHGYQVLVCANGVEALQLWETHGRKVALLLTDLVMPGGIGGSELGNRLRESNPRLKVIYMSGYSEDIAGQQIQLEAGERFLQKPFRSVQLFEAIRRCLDA